MRSVLELYRQNLFINSLLLLPYTIVIRIYSLIYPETILMYQADGWLNLSFIQSIASYPRLQAIICIILVFLQAVSINYLVNTHKLSIRPHLLGGLFYILLVSLHRDFLPLSPIILGNIFILIALINLMRTYRVTRISGSIFNGGLFIAFASAFFFPYIVFIIPGYIGLLILRSFRMKERMQFLMGAVVFAYLFFAVLFYFKLDKIYFFDYLKANLPSFSMIEPDQGIILSGLLYIIAIVVVVVNYYSLRKKKSIQSQKKIDILYWLMIFSPIAMIFWHNIQVSSIMIVAIPLSVMIGMFIYRIKNKAIAELIHLALVIIIVIQHFKPSLLF